MKLADKKRIIAVAILLLAIIAAVAFVLFNQNTKTSMVTGTYSNSKSDGCDGFYLKNGDKVDTFCFWSKSSDQFEYDKTIGVGDKVEYGTELGKKFIRLKK